jgi:hypothetical protein
MQFLKPVKTIPHAQNTIVFLFLLTLSYKITMFLLIEGITIEEDGVTVNLHEAHVFYCNIAGEWCFSVLQENSVIEENIAADKNMVSSLRNNTLYDNQELTAVSGDVQDCRQK